MTATIDAGANFRIDLDGDVLVLVVWRREDLSSTEGAELAERMTSAMGKIAAQPRVRAMVLDLAESPPVVGPRTLATIGALVERVAGLGKEVRLVHPQSAVGRMQFERLVRTHAPLRGRVAASLSAARASLPTS